MTDLISTMLVPMYVDGLLVTPHQATGASGSNFDRWQMDYARLEVLESPMPPPFNDQFSPQPQGMNLQWVLPSGLRSGTMDSTTGQVSYPYAPNRWLVVRIQQPADSSPPPVKAWVLISDDLGEEKSNPFVDPAEAAAGRIVPTTIGSSMTLDEWNSLAGSPNGPPQPSSPFLTAIGPGNVTFCEFQPGIDNVFAFNDSCEDLQTRTELSYLVIGWYSQAAMDPLDPGNISQPPTSDDSPAGPYWSTSPAGDSGITAVPYHWNLPEITDPADAPTTSLIHGMFYGAVWDPSQQTVPPPDEFPSDQQQQTNIRVAVGNTSVDAISALIGYQAEQAASDTQADENLSQLLQGLQLGAVESASQLGGNARLQQLIRRAEYGTRSGGTRWVVVPSDSDAAPEDDNPDLTPDQKTWLANLNSNQQTLDAAIRILESMQWQLYALWWQYNDQIIADAEALANGRKGIPADVLEQFKAQLTSDAAALSTFQAALQTYGGAIQSAPNGVPSKSAIDAFAAAEQATESLSYIDQVQCQTWKVAALRMLVPIASGDGSAASIDVFAVQAGLDPKTQALKAFPGPRFWAPNDPVVLIANAGRPLRERAPRSLTCRDAARTVTSLATDPSNAKASGLMNALADVLPTISITTPTSGPGSLSDVTTALLNEAFLMNPNNAATIAAKLPGSPSAAEVQTAIDDLIAQPALTMVSREWQQPWAPLFLDWYVSWHPTSSAEDWTFNGTDYEPTSDAGKDALTSFDFQGRTFLTPHAASHLAESVRRYAANHQPAPDSPQAAVLDDLRALAEDIRGWDVFSQTISGFTSLLAQREMDFNVSAGTQVVGGDDNNTITDSVKALVGSSTDGVPYLGTSGFHPIRAGFLRFTNLRLLDSYGRYVYLGYANENNTATTAQDFDTFQPILSPAVTPPSDDGKSAGYIQLPPRVVEAGRLRFSLVNGTDSSQEISLEPDANPVCGWLLPNHPDRSLAVYDANGHALGELLVLLTGDGQALRFEPAPGRAAPTNLETSVTFENKQLQEMVNQLLAAGAAAFEDLLQIVDETLWTIDPLGGRDDQNLSVLVGRPIAVVRANLQLQLDGLPFYNQDYNQLLSQTGTTVAPLGRDDGGLSSLRFPVRLGDVDQRNDGLLGYFLGHADGTTDYRSFNTVRDVPGSGDLTDYIQSIDGGNFIDLSFQPTRPTAPGASPFDTTGSATLTMLLDPRGCVHATTSLLPVKRLELPDRFVAPALAAMDVTFRVGPIPIDRGTVRLPRPSQQNGRWTWMQPTGTGAGDWQIDPIVPANDRARLEGQPPILRDGWLRFSSKSAPPSS